MSKATPIGAIARFAASGKPQPRKDLGLMAMTYGSVYVAQIAMGANDTQTVKAFLEAERYSGPSLIIAYSHCIAHNIDMTKGLEHQKLAEQSGFWPLFRYNPTLVHEGKSPLILDSKPPKVPFVEFARLEGRFRMLERSDPKRAAELLEKAQRAIDQTYSFYQYLSGFNPSLNSLGKKESVEEVMNTKLVLGS
jgi:pyruvate-ferredoxin/flavodoxin oxidoreductase